jgi:uncharacterized membrane protein YfcA
MDLLDAALLLATGIAGGVVSALVGGAALITFPALLAAGLAPVAAAATNSVALLPGNLVAAVYDRSQLPPLDRSFAGLIAWALLGGAAGAALLLATSERVLEVLIPLLLGFATILFGYAGRISARLRAYAATHGEWRHKWTHGMAAVLPPSVYGGYFGAGVGVVFLGIMAIWTGGDYRRANVSKNLVVSCNGVVAAVIFIVQGAVVWLPALIMMVGALAGGIVGARIAQRVPHRLMRHVVVGVGTLLTAVFAWRYWL